MFSLRRRLAALSCAVLGAVALVATQPVSAATRPVSGAFVTGYAIARPVCNAVPRPGRFTCMAMERVDVAKGTPGAYRYVMPAALTQGPHGGYTPNDLAFFYGFNPHLARKNQTIAVVDWYTDPHARADLNHFDKHYGFPKETARSFRIVNQHGGTRLPAHRADQIGAIEISLDVQSARAVCRTCKVILIEADGPFDSDLATAQNTAVRLGATEISDSYGGPEHKVAAKIVAAYNHPGVVTTVSTGDHGWYGWDLANPGGSSAQQAASFPSTLPTVVSVGGTLVGLDVNTHKRAEIVWNENGLEDQVGLNGSTNANPGPQGATGGGCSKRYSAKPWQRHYPGYGKAGCDGKRLAADVAAIADPQLGFDIYDTWRSSGWLTIGGTSLASPVTAAMFALAGGAKGAAYPAASIYVNAQVHKPSVYDVNNKRYPGDVSGSGFCGGVPAPQCGTDLFASTLKTPRNQHTHNPNSLGAGLVDCSFSHNRKSRANATGTSRECNTFPGFDGPTGLGAPNSPRLFTATNPQLALSAPNTIKANARARFVARARQLVPHTRITGFEWQWGDGSGQGSAGHTGSVSRAVHRYPHAGGFTITVRVTDSRFQVTIRHLRITVKHR